MAENIRNLSAVSVISVFYAALSVWNVYAPGSGSCYQNPKINHSKMSILRLSTFDSGAKFNGAFRKFCHSDNSSVA